MAYLPKYAKRCEKQVTFEGLITMEDKLKFAEMWWDLARRESMEDKLPFPGNNNSSSGDDYSSSYASSYGDSGSSSGGDSFYSCDDESTHSEVDSVGNFTKPRNLHGIMDVVLCLSQLEIIGAIILIGLESIVVFGSNGNTYSRLESLGYVFIVTQLIAVGCGVQTWYAALTTVNKPKIISMVLQLVSACIEEGVVLSSFWTAEDPKTIMKQIMNAGVVGMLILHIVVFLLVTLSLRKPIRAKMGYSESFEMS